MAAYSPQADTVCTILSTETIVELYVDFYCAKARLVIELDGSQHYDPNINKKMQKGTNH